MENRKWLDFERLYDAIMRPIEFIIKKQCDDLVILEARSKIIDQMMDLVEDNAETNHYTYHTVTHHKYSISDINEMMKLATELEATLKKDYNTGSVSKTT